MPMHVMAHIFASGVAIEHQHNDCPSGVVETVIGKRAPSKPCMDLYGGKRDVVCAYQVLKPSD